MNEYQSILDIVFPFVENLLKEYGEFYPLACAVNLDGEVEHVLLEEDEEFDQPASTSVIGELKKELRFKRENFKAVGMFYDVRVENSDAIAIFVEHKAEKEAFTFYYPYELTKNNLVFGESWKVIAQQEIFVN